MLAYLLLGVAQVIGLVLVPFGGPGIWLQVGALALFAWNTGFDRIDPIPLFLVFVAALTVEIAEAPLAGGRIPPESRRFFGGWGMAGGALGAGAGSLFPLLGSAFGALVGALTGVALALVQSRWRSPGRGPRIGWALAMAMRAAAGIVVATFTLLML